VLIYGDISIIVDSMSGIHAYQSECMKAAMANISSYSTFAVANYQQLNCPVDELLFSSIELIGYENHGISFHTDVAVLKRV
jgi:hypothetical protein